MISFGGVALIIFVLWVAACLNVLREYERGVIFRLGRLQRPDKGPGLIFILWPIDKLIKVSLRTVAWTSRRRTSLLGTMYP